MRPTESLSPLPAALRSSARTAAYLVPAGSFVAIRVTSPNTVSDADVTVWLATIVVVRSAIAYVAARTAPSLRSFAVDTWPLAFLELCGIAAVVPLSALPSNIVAGLFLAGGAAVMLRAIHLVAGNGKILETRARSTIGAMLFCVGLLPAAFCLLLAIALSTP